MSTITASSNKAVIRRSEVKTQTPGGIVLPELAQDKVCSGVIVSVSYDEFQPKEFNAGDLVIYKRFSDTEIEVDGENYAVVNLEDILVTIGE